MVEHKQIQSKEDTSKAMKLSLQFQSSKPSLLESSDISFFKRKRSKTDNVFMYRPEFVPRPRPKATDVLPTPMLLCGNPPAKPGESLLSSLNSNREESKWTEDVEQWNINEVSSLFNDIRKELAEIRSANSNKHKAKDYEPVLDIETKLNDFSDFRFSTRKSQRKSIWKKFIEKEDQLDNQMRYSMKTGHYSILNILEAAANESLKKKIQVI